MNKDDLFREKIVSSDIRTNFPVSRICSFTLVHLRFPQDFEGAAGDYEQGRDYFKKRFVRLSQKAGRPKEREVYVQ